MPKIDLDQFETAPEIGDTVTITGKVQEIKDGKVHMSYDTLVTLPGSSENTDVSVDESLEKYMSTQKKQEDNVATQ